jgi:hypothetical protein
MDIVAIVDIVVGGAMVISLAIGTKVRGSNPDEDDRF